MNVISSQRGLPGLKNEYLSKRGALGSVVLLESRG